MNETEAHELYQKIFSADRLERWESWKRHCNTEGCLPEGVDHPLARIPKTKKRWNGGMTHMNGYRFVLVPDHPKASPTGHVREHVLAAEIALGRFLPEGAVVHHDNENKADNYSDGNLIMCESLGHHAVIHRRMRALKGCGHADWLRCSLCKTWDAPENLVLGHHPRRIGPVGRHRACHAADVKRRAHEKEARSGSKCLLHNLPAASSVPA